MAGWLWQSASPPVMAVSQEGKRSSGGINNSDNAWFVSLVRVVHASQGLRSRKGMSHMLKPRHYTHMHSHTTSHCAGHCDKNNKSAALLLQRKCAGSPLWECRSTSSANVYMDVSTIYVTMSGFDLRHVVFVATMREWPHVAVS